MFRFGNRTLENLTGVHAHLIVLATHALSRSRVDFGVLSGGGLRSMDEQRRLIKAGRSKTLNSRHLTGHALDLVAYDGGEVVWDWPAYELIAEAMFAASDHHGIPVEWGGHWVNFRDGPHFQLPRREYP